MLTAPGAQEPDSLFTVHCSGQKAFNRTEPHQLHGGPGKHRKSTGPGGWQIQMPVHIRDARGLGSIYMQSFCTGAQHPGATHVWQVTPAVNTPQGERLGGEGRAEPNHGRKGMSLIPSWRPQPRLFLHLSQMVAEARIKVCAVFTETFTPIPADASQSLRKAVLIAWFIFLFF